MIVARAPVRISFGGGGTDLPAYYAEHGGFVVSAAITRYCYVAASAAEGFGTRITSADYQRSECFDEPVPAVAEPLSLPRAAIERFGRHGLLERGIDLFLASDVPPGTGLGSSSAMAVALLRAISSYLGLELDAPTLAALACELEIERLARPIGKQDQYAAAFGGLNTITFSATGVQVQPLNLPGDLAQALDARLMLFSTGQSRDSAAILGKQGADSRTKPTVIEALHRIKALAAEMRQALLAGELDQFGRLLDQGWQQKRSLSPQISSSAIDGWYAAARAAGALGGKIAGAGGGGHLLLYCTPERQPAVREALARAGLRELGFRFDYTGAQIVPDSLRSIALGDTAT